MSLQNLCSKYIVDTESHDDKKDKKDVLKKIKEKKLSNPDGPLAKPDQWLYDLASISNLDLKLKIFNFRFR